MQHITAIDVILAARQPVTFALLNLCNTHNYIVFTHKLEVHPACDLNIIVKGDWLLKVTGSHVHWKVGNISELVLDRVVITEGH